MATGKPRWSPLLAAIFLQLGCACSGDAAKPVTPIGSANAAGRANEGGDASGGVAGDGGDGIAGAAGAGGAATTAPETLANGVVTMTHPKVSLFGRWARGTDGSVKGNWGPIGFKLRFESPSVALTLADQPADLGEEGTGSRYHYRIDNGPVQLAPGGQNQLTLATGLAPGGHTLEFVRRTESRFGITTLKSLRLAPASRLLDPGPRAPLRIEVLGDSISAGLANENTGWYTNESQNGDAAYGPLLARALNAEYHILARGGGTFINEYWKPQPKFFDRVFGPMDTEAAPENEPASTNPKWDFAAYVPDVFVLALGTNDFSLEQPHIDEAEYVGKYTAFLRQVRAVYPRALLVCLEPLKEGAPWDEARRYIPLAVKALADARVIAVDPVGPTPSSTRWLTYPADYVTNDEYHPNLAGHQKLAARLEPIIRKALNP